MKIKTILISLILFASFFSSLAQDSEKATRFEQARGLALCTCIEYQQQMIDSTYQSKDYSVSYFVQMSDLSLEEITAIIGYTNKNCIKYVGIPQEIDGNMLGYSCWRWYKSKELNRFIKKTLKSTSKPENPPAIDYLKKVSTMADSVTIATIYSSTKEDLLPFNETTTKPVDTTYVIQSAKMTNKEVRTLNNKLNNFGDELALPNHYDIEIKYYLKDSVYSTIIISSMTRNISILNNIECDHDEFSWDNFNQTECLFRSKISADMEKYLTRLLQKKKLWTKSQNLFEW